MKNEGDKQAKKQTNKERRDQTNKDGGKKEKNRINKIKKLR